MKIGFIGLGLMGMPMAKNILKKGFTLSVYNRTASKTIELKKLGAFVAKSPSELGETCDIVITMVTQGKDVKEVLFGKNGVVKNAKKGLIVIDMSTIGPKYAREIYNELKKKSIEFLDAPVTGSTPKAITGELTIFIGGKKHIFEKAKPVLEAMGTNLQYIGENGTGQAIKLINNQIIAVSITAVAEGMLLADAMKLDRKKAAEVLETVPATSGFMRLKLPNFVKNEFPLLFSVANMKKDLMLAKGESKTKLPVLENVIKLYQKASKSGLDNSDMSEIIKVIK